MAYKAYVGSIQNGGDASGINVIVQIADVTNNMVYDNAVLVLAFGTELVNYTVSEYQNALAAKILAYSVAQGYGITANDIVWSVANSRSFTNNASHSIQTVAAAANGFQLSATRDAQVSYTATIVTAATLLAGAVGSVVLEIAATNSSSAGAWQEIGRITNGQVFSLAVAIGCNQTISGSISGMIPAGYYARLRSINTTGTPTYTYNSGQEVLL